MKLEDYSKKHIHYHTEEIPSLLEGLFIEYQPQNIADLGSGDGSILYGLKMRGHLEDLNEITAIDISPDRIANVQTISSDIKCHVADVSQLEMLKEASLDLAISSQVIEHLPDDERFLNSVNKVLKNNGIFYLSTVYKKWYGWYFYRCNGKWVLDPTHVREYTTTQVLEEKIRKSGFSILNTQMTLFQFPVTDFIVKRIGKNRSAYANPLMKGLRKIKVPIPGYYNWELVLRKRSENRPMNEKISVCIPVYNGADTIRWTIDSILKQTYQDFELLIVDNCSIDDTAEIVASFEDPRIRFEVNEQNLGCGGNLESCKEKATGDILFYMSADDLADRNAVKHIFAAFQKSDEIGIVTRPYYWFDKSHKQAVRAKRQFDAEKTVSMGDSFESIKHIIESADQISGIGFRKKFMKHSFVDKPFIEMASMVLPMLKSCKAVMLKDNIVAVRISNSGAQSPRVFKNSPMQAWANIIEQSYQEPEYNDLRTYLRREFVANNHIGLVQIKNFGGVRPLLREILLMVRMNKQNLLNPVFWIFTFGTILTPSLILKPMVNAYKKKVNARLVNNISPCEIS